jgi:tRNA (cmo5U34)-methyltransferase
MTRDEVFKAPRPQIVDFAFDESVAGVFPDMIRRSVPGYELVVPMTGLLAARHLIAGATAGGPLRVYDLGCSLGATSLAILGALESLGAAPNEKGTDELEIVAVDNAPAMLTEARGHVTDPRVRFVEADVRDLVFDPCRVVTMNWLLQFLPPDDRLDVLVRIRDALAGEGLLLVSEKIRYADTDMQAFSDAAHLDFKRANGYSELEISQKRTALEQVMLTDTVEAHLERFQAAGFQTARLWFQCLNWAAFAVQ